MASVFTKLMIMFILAIYMDSCYGSIFGSFPQEPETKLTLANQCHRHYMTLVRHCLFELRMANILKKPWNLSTYCCNEVKVVRIDCLNTIFKRSPLDAIGPEFAGRCRAVCDKPPLHSLPPPPQSKKRKRAPPQPYSFERSSP